MTQPTRLRDMAASTPSERNRAIDAIRALAILAVVLGHWLMAIVYLEDGEVEHQSILGLRDWTHLATWAFQVIPVIFVVGGYANAVSWRHARTEHTTYAGWLRNRMRRLSSPIVPLLVFWLLAVPVLQWAGAAPELMRSADRGSMVPLWFLTAYLLVMIMTPLTLALWDRFGWGSVVGGLALAGAGDAVSLRLDSLELSVVSALVVWLTVHQIGYAWRDGRLARTAVRLLMAGGGLFVLWLLIYPGPYQVSMVGVDAPGISNARPARVTLAVLGVAYAGVLSLLAPLLDRACRHAAVWTAVVGINARIMTIYIWHLTAAGLVVLAAPYVSPPGLEEIPGSVEWWWTRPQWILWLALPTTALVLVFGRFERHDARPGPAWPAPVQLAAACATALGIGMLAKQGIVSWGGDFHWELGSALLALVILQVHQGRASPAITDR